MPTCLPRASRSVRCRSRFASSGTVDSHVATRRDIVKLALGAGAWMALGACRKKAAPQVSDKGPRYWVQILLSGGHDTLYTTDPKVAKDVDGLVTLPTDNKITQAGGLT